MNIFIEVQTFEEVHDGLRPFMIAPTAIIRGAGLTFSIPIIEVEATTGYYNSNLNNKAIKAVELM
jgi:2,3-bisphosphoglycerate-independent phosphoglycerate mutase